MKHDLTPESFMTKGNSARFHNEWLYLRGLRGTDINLSHKITTSDIDMLQDHPNTDCVTVSTLNQETFEYFINNYGKQLKAIYFHKNNTVKDWSLLGELPQLEYIYWFWNQRIEKFWDMSKNISLKAIELNDFSRLKSIDGIETAPNLKGFAIGEAIWSKSELKSFAPLSKCKGIEYIYFFGKNIIDTDFSFLKDLKELKIVSLKSNLLSTEQYAWIVGNCPHLKGKNIEPAWTFDHSSYTWVSVFGKGKRGFKLEGNEEKLKKIEAEFWALADSLKDKPYPKSGH